MHIVLNQVVRENLNPGKQIGPGIPKGLGKMALGHEIHASSLRLPRGRKPSRDGGVYAAQVLLKEGPLG